MPRARRHHLVAQAYQRAWSADGHRVVLVDKHDKWCRLVGTRDAFVVPDLLTVRADEGDSDLAEQAFSKIENQVMPGVKRFIDGSDDAEARRDVVVLAALHWARGEATTNLMRSIVASTLDQLVGGAESDERFAEAFERGYGRPPEPGERAALTREVADGFVASNAFFVERVLEAHNRAIDMWQERHVQRVTPLRASGPDFLFADAPVVVTDGPRGTASRPLALGDATSIFFPLSPTTAVALRTRPLPAVKLEPWRVQLLNLRTLMWARRFLGAHPDSDVDWALAAKPGTYVRVGR